MANSQLLSEVITDYLASRANTMAPMTVKNDGQTLRQFLAVVGNIQVKNVTTDHVERYFAVRANTCKASTMNTDLYNLTSFFKWCRMHKRTPATHDPLVARKPIVEEARERLWIPERDFPRVLKAANDPRDRMIVACGLFLFTRISETSRLRLSDIDPDNSRVTVTRAKKYKGQRFTRQVLPMTKEFRREWERWMKTYKTTAGLDLRPTDYLCPAKTTGGWGGTRGSRGFERLPEAKLYRPAANMGTGWQPVQKALENLGYPVVQEGGHTLRRSGARALYFRLASGNHDHAVRRVMTMLGHASQSTTEKYIGLDIDEAARDALLLDQWMFPDTFDAEENVPDNVISLFGRDA